MSVGHDEYWSGEQRANVEAARDAGVNLGSSAATRSTGRPGGSRASTSSATAYRTLVCYKETWDNAKIDPSPEWTGTWRDPRFSPPSDGGRPENALTGTAYRSTTLDAAHRRCRPRRQDAVLAEHPVATQHRGDRHAGAVHLGYESDEDLDNGFRPAGLFRLSTTTGRSTSTCTTSAHHGARHHDPPPDHVPGAQRRPGVRGRHDPVGLGLAVPHDGAAAPPDRDQRMQQATVNLLADMGQPATLDGDACLPPPPAPIPRPPRRHHQRRRRLRRSPTASLVTVTGTATDVGGRGRRRRGLDRRWHHLASGHRPRQLDVHRPCAGFRPSTSRPGPSTTVATSRPRRPSVTVIGCVPLLACSPRPTCPTLVTSPTQIPAGIELGREVHQRPRRLGHRRSFLQGRRQHRYPHRQPVVRQRHPPGPGHLHQRVGQRLADGRPSRPRSRSWLDTTYVASYFAPSGGYSSIGQLLRNGPHGGSAAWPGQRRARGQRRVPLRLPAPSPRPDSRAPTTGWIPVFTTVGRPTAPAHGGRHQPGVQPDRRGSGDPAIQDRLQRVDAGRRPSPGLSSPAGAPGEQAPPPTITPSRVATSPRRRPWRLNTEYIPSR